MKYFAIFNRNFVTIFHLQLKIGNNFDAFLQYSVVCGDDCDENNFFYAAEEHKEKKYKGHDCLNSALNVLYIYI